MPSLRMLWNILAPWRRRRRYYFLQVLAKLSTYDLTPAEKAAAFSASMTEFAELLRGWSLPPAYVEGLAAGAYKVPPPSFLLTYGPALAVLAALASAIALRLLLR
jgi:hypothetical protein